MNIDELDGVGEILGICGFKMWKMVSRGQQCQHLPPLCGLCYTLSLYSHFNIRYFIEFCLNHQNQLPLTIGTYHLLL